MSKRKLKEKEVDNYLETQVKSLMEPMVKGLLREKSGEPVIEIFNNIR